MTADSVAMSLLREPLASVSSLLQVGRVTPTEHAIYGHRVIPVDDKWAQARQPLSIRLARSLPEFVEICGTSGLDPAAVRA